MRILDGRAMATAWRAELKNTVRDMSQPPRLVIVLVGADPAGRIYTDLKMKVGQGLGIQVERMELLNPTEAELLAKLKMLNHDPSVDGYLIQFPLPGSISASTIVRHISPEKDVDGLHPVNLGELAFGGQLMPATTKAICKILAEAQIELAGRSVVVLGRSRIVGLPTALVLIARDATVTICHSKTEDLTLFTKQADIIITATGQHGVLTPPMVKQGVVVIDAGFSHHEGRNVGDVDHAAFRHLAAAITPTPGGVGPMTVTALFDNLIELTEEQGRQV